VPAAGAASSSNAHGERQPSLQVQVQHQQSAIFEVVIPTIHQRTFGEVNLELLDKAVNGVLELRLPPPLQTPDLEKGLGAGVLFLFELEGLMVL